MDIPLAPKGIEQAEMTSEGMKDIPFDHIFSSPLKRAYKTAQVVRRDRPIEIVRDDRLKEMSFGTSEGKIIGKIMANPALVRYQRFRLQSALSASSGRRLLEGIALLQHLNIKMVK